MINHTDQPLALGMHPADTVDNDNKHDDLAKEEVVVAPSIYDHTTHLEQEDQAPPVTKKELWLVVEKLPVCFNWVISDVSSVPLLSIAGLTVSEIACLAWFGTDVTKR